MNTEKDRRYRFSLTFLFSVVVFCFLVLTMAVVALIIVLLLRLRVLEFSTDAMRPATFILIIVLTSILIGTGLSISAGGIPLLSINTIINAMNRLAAGDFKTRLNYTGLFSRLGFVREFSSSFNKMASELESTEMLRSDFINNFSHEFKTPIVSIAGFARLLKKGGLTPEEEREYLDIIERESLRLSDMATAVLNMTRVENQTILTDVTEFNLSEQLRNCVLLLEDKWSRKNLSLSLEFDEYTVAANEELLRQVWLNLLDNAVKFSPVNGDIEITIAEPEDSLAVTILNYGSQIPPDSRERIFQKFYQADESRATEGTGIGLAVVDRIVKLHGGRVEVDSRPDRTAFTVFLPRKAE